MALKLTVLMLITAACEIGFIDAFRTDYTYVESTRSFYKFHKTDAKWADARSTCQSEGALLFHPENEQEFKQVVSVLGIGRNDGMFINAGYSDLTILKSYQTVDGRPIANVYNKWDDDQPKSGSNNENRCGRLRLDTFALVLTDCTSSRRYICKHYETTIENVVKTAIEDVKAIIANSSDKITAALERQSTNLSAAEDKPTAALERIAANQASLLERLTEAIAHQAAAIDRQTEAVQRQAINQTLIEAIAHQAAAMDRQTEAVQRQAINQTLALERIAASLVEQKEVIERLSANQVGALDRHTETFHREAANQTAVFERQALAMEKLSSLLEDNSQIDTRSEQ